MNLVRIAGASLLLGVALLLSGCAITTPSPLYTEGVRVNLASGLYSCISGDGTPGKIAIAEIGSGSETNATYRALFIEGGGSYDLLFQPAKDSTQQSGASVYILQAHGTGDEKGYYYFKFVSQADNNGTLYSVDGTNDTLESIAKKNRVTFTAEQYSYPLKGKTANEVEFLNAAISEINFKIFECSLSK